MTEAARKLANLTHHPAFTGVKAVRSGNVNGVWYQLYNSPYRFVTVQHMTT